MREESRVKRKATLAFDPKAFLAKLGKGRTLADYEKNNIVFSQGDPADAIFYVQKGKIKLAVVSKEGKEAVIAILGPGDFFGEGCLAGQLVRMATAATMTSALLCGWTSRRSSVCSTASPSFLNCSFITFSPVTFGSRKIWWISYSIRARSAWRGYFC
jgi:hypothetical protein